MWSSAARMFRLRIRGLWMRNRPGRVRAEAGTPGAAAGRAILLSYGRLAPFGQSFAHEMNTMRKDLADADAVLRSSPQSRRDSLVPYGGGR